MNTIFPGPRWVKRAGAGLAIASLFASHSAHAAPVKVTGSINPGTACTANLSNAELAYGEIKTSELSADKPTVLPTKPFTLNVVCAPLASKFYFRVLDRNQNRSNPRENLAEAAGVPVGDQRAGMGLGMTDDDRALGGLFVRSSVVLADTQEKIILQKFSIDNDESDTWSKRPSDFLWGDVLGMRRYMLADSISLVASAAKNFMIQMNAIPVISPSAIKGLLTDVQLDSKLTIEITQL